MERRIYGPGTMWPAPGPAEPEAPRQEWLTVPQAARRYPITAAQLYRLVREGEIPHMPRGNRYLLRPQAIEEYLLSLERRGIPA